MMKSGMKHLSSLALAGLLVTPLPPWPPADAEEAGGSGSGPVAVIINAANKSADPSFDQLAAMLRLEKQFWPDGKRVVLLLPPTGSMAKNVLLQKVYHRTDPQLRQDWARRLFAGEIPAVPTTLRTVDAQVAAVTRSAGAITVVPAKALLPAGVRVLAVEGKRPGEPGYRLSADEP